jgi:hypothetical protein
MATAADKDPVLAALPAEVRERVERTLQSYDTDASPSTAFPLFPEQPAIDDTDWDKIVANAERIGLPPAPRRKLAGPNYVLGSQPSGWVAKSIKQSAPKPNRLTAAKPLPERPAWSSSPSGRWRTSGHSGVVLRDRRI